VETDGRAFQSPVARTELALAEPGIHEHASLTGFDAGAIVAGATAEEGKFDSHRRASVSSEEAGNFFDEVNLTLALSEHKVH